MFSLIVTIIAIALVAVLGLSTLYFGGTAFNQGTTRAEAAKVMNQGQQLIGAADLYYADHGFWPASMEVLEGESYLQSIPVAERGAVTPAFAGATAWVMVAPSHPVFSVSSSGTDACRGVNLMASGVDGVPAHVITSWTTQCYGTSTGDLRILTAKNVIELNLAIPATIDAPANCTSADWLVAPQSCGASPLGVAVGTLTGDMAFGDQTMGTTSATRYATLSNTGNAILDITDLTISGPFSFLHDCGTTLGIGLYCTASVNFSPVAEGNATGQLRITSSGGTSIAPLSGFGTFASDSLVPHTLAFAATALGAASAAQDVTLTNAGNIPLGLSPVTFNAPFSAATTCTTSLAVGASCTYSVSFSPTVMGEALDSVNVTTAAGVENLSLSGVGTQLSASAAPGTLTMATTNVGATSAAQTVTLTNTGNLSVNIASDTALGPFAASTTCGTTLAVGANCTYSVSFSPTVMGDAAGSLSIVTDAGTKTISLSALGTQVSASATPGSLTLATTNVGATSAAQTVTLTNTGNLPFDVTSGSTAAPFAVSTTCGATLAASATCTYSVSFSPTVMGDATGSLSIVTGAGTYSVSLGAYASQSVATLTPGSLTFASTSLGATTAAQTVTLANTGNTTLTVSPATFAAPYAGTTTCTTSLAVGASCTYSVTFTPSAMGAAPADVSIVTSEATHTLSLSGFGTQLSGSILPSTLTFAATAVGGVSAAQSVVLTNTGNLPLTVTAAAATGTFSQNGNCPDSLAAGEHCSYQVTFNPTAMGTATGSLSILTDAQEFIVGLNGWGDQLSGSLAPTSVTFAATAIGSSAAEQVVTVSNTGNTPMSMSAVTFAAPFSATTTCTTSLAAGATCTYSVGFTPSAMGNAAASVSVVTSAATYTLELSGYGTQLSGTLTPSTLTFASTNLGASAAAQTATLTNTGNLPLAITSGGAPAPFSSTTTCGATLDAGNSCTYSVGFSPTVMGAASGTLSVVTGDGTKTAALDGWGDQASSTVSTALLTLASTQVGSTSAAQTVTLTNTGNTTLTISTPSVTAPFAVSATTCGATLAASTSCTYSATFTPTGAGDDFGTLFIEPSSGEQVVSLFGTGSQGNASLSPSSLTFGTTTVGQSAATQTVTLTNNGTTALTVSGVTVSTGAADYSRTTTCATVAVNGTCTVTVTFTPSASGARPGTITFAHNGTGSTSFALSGTGSGAASVLTSSFSPATVTIGTGSTFTWTTSGAASATVACTGTATGSGSGTSGSFAVTTSGTGLGTCTVTALNAAGTAYTGSGNLTVVAAPAVTSATFSQATVPAGATDTFSWTTGGGATSATVACTGKATGSGSGLSGSFAATTLTGTGAGTCTVSATNAAGTTATGADMMTVIPATYTLGVTGGSFTDTGVGSASAGVVFTTTNNGNTSVTLSATTPTVTSGFSITANTCTASKVLAPGATCTTTVTGTPTVLGANTGTLTIGAATGNGTAALYITGIVPPPVLVTISSSTTNYNLYTARGNPSVARDYIVTINSGVIVSSTSTASPAFTTGALPAGSTVKIINLGLIQGRGGDGGPANQLAGTAGNAGGPALQATMALTLDNTGGSIFGGGGGGGSTYGDHLDMDGSGGAGGGSGGNRGNAGTSGLAGVGGASGSRSTGWYVNTVYTMGVTYGGAGGGYGQAGSVGSVGGAMSLMKAWPGGAAGAAVVKGANSVTWLGGNVAAQVKGAQ